MFAVACAPGEINERKTMKNILAIFVLLVLSGCADSVSFNQAASLPSVGFWYGLWHGMICPIAWIVSLFDSDVAIYAIYNNGGWYDFGFVLGAGIIGGSSSAAKRK